MPPLRGFNIITGKSCFYHTITPTGLYLAPAYILINPVGGEIMVADQYTYLPSNPVRGDIIIFLFSKMKIRKFHPYGVSI